jgi:hypothetical protein
MAYIEEIFNVSEDATDTQEIFSVAEDVVSLPKEERAPVTPAPIQFPPQNPVVPQQPGVANKEQSLDEEEGWRSSKDPKLFMPFLQNEIRRIGNPHLWRTKSEKERGLAQLKKLDHFISEALRNDHESVLDVPSIDALRNQLERHIDECEIALEGIQNMKKQRRRMRRGEEELDMVKEAGTPHFNGISVNITPFERAIVGALINGTVSGGRNMEELYEDVKKKYDLNPREELSIFQILADMGYPTFKDRLRIGEKDGDPSREEGFGEWNSTYHA